MPQIKGHNPLLIAQRAKRTGCFTGAGGRAFYHVYRKISFFFFRLVKVMTESDSDTGQMRQT